MLTVDAVDTLCQASDEAFEFKPAVQVAELPQKIDDDKWCTVISDGKNCPRAVLSTTIEEMACVRVVKFRDIADDGHNIVLLDAVDVDSLQGHVLACPKPLASPNPYHDQAPNQSAQSWPGNFGQPSGQPQMNVGQPSGQPQMNVGQPSGQPQMNVGQPMGQPHMNVGQSMGQPHMNVGQPMGHPQMNVGQPMGQPQVAFGQPSGQPQMNFAHSSDAMYGHSDMGQAQPKGNHPGGQTFAPGVQFGGAENIPGGAAQFGGGQMVPPSVPNLYMQQMQRQGQGNAYQQTFGNHDPYTSVAAKGAGRGAARGPVVRAASSTFVPLRELSCYNNKWVVKARVTVKSDRRKFMNQRGEGQLFSVDLVDESGGETRATFFGKAVDTWYDFLQAGKVYSFTKGQVKPANRKFYTKSDYEITFDDNAMIEKLDDSEGASIPGLQYNFVPLKTIATTEVNVSVDVKGILVEIRDPITMSLKSGIEKRKRSLYIADESDTKCEFTIWGDKADQEYEKGVAIFLKNARVGDFGGRNLSNQASCHIEIAPDDRRAFDLKNWYENGGCNSTFTPLASGGSGSSSRTTMERMIEEDVSIGISIDGKDPKKTHWHNVCPAYVAYIVKEFPPFYLACPAQVDGTDKEGRPNQRLCNKKSEAVPDSEVFICSNGHSCPKPTARFIARIKIQDYTNQVEATAFDEVGQKLFQTDANEVWRLWEMKDKDELAGRQLEEVFARAFFTRWNMKIKSVKEQYQEEDRIKRQVMEITPVNVIDETQRNLEILEKNA